MVDFIRPIRFNTHSLQVMADDTARAKARLSTLTRSLDELESTLEPLFTQTLSETVLPLETIQQAKLQVAIPYLTYDLVFIYLKTRGLDPKTHPVVGELDRIKQYFGKIKDAEDPAKRQLVVDKAAAGRFIKHAISQARAAPPQPAPGPSTHLKYDDDGTPRDVRVPIRVTDKMREREKYQKELREADEAEEEEEDLEMFDDDDEPVEISSAGASGMEDKGKGKAKASSIDLSEGTASAPVARSKRRRPPVDPFAGYGDNTPARPTSAKRPKITNTEGSSDMPVDIAAEDVSSGTGTGANTPTLPEASSTELTESNAKPTKKSAKTKKKKSRPLSSTQG
ncbi:hypothetical protein EW146_g7757 [Bondarzewia mesenterica]|uniref:Exosome complex protein n=1 Tax=Bondarzewia mesenterica TaxID=1095465 RepID=A0A4S4LLJ3_9AGAM|nr:hypothetical protein EW146_g7757 [Bondarzewia mesenterica]